MKIYEIEITIHAVVQAESLEDAYGAAYSDRRDILSDAGMDCIDVNGEILKGQRLPAGWVDACYPYGRAADANNVKTIAQIWEEQE